MNIQLTFFHQNMPKILTSVVKVPRQIFWILCFFIDFTYSSTNPGFYPKNSYPTWISAGISSQSYWHFLSSVVWQCNNTWGSLDIYEIRGLWTNTKRTASISPQRSFTFKQWVKFSYDWEGGSLGAYRILRPMGKGSSEGTSPRMPKALRGVPEVDPDLRGQENPISPGSDKSIGFT